MSTAEDSWPRSHVQEIALPSNVVNLLNFVVFDILLVSLVFYFTSEISGRLNFLDLSDGTPKRLKMSCPPIVGGGLCSTSRTRLYSMLFIRIVSFILMFASNLAIDGSSRQEIVEIMGLRSVPGSISNFTTEQLRKAIYRRLSCQTSSNNFMYFGELRENDVCEYNLDLLTEPVSVSLIPQALTINTGICRVENKVARNPKYSFRTFRCKNALIMCVIRRKAPVGKQFLPENCRGVLQGEGETHACDEFIKRQGDKWTGSCRVIRNFPLTNEDWLPALRIYHATISETIGAITIAKEENTTLKTKGPTRKVTQVHYGWFAVLAAKVLLALVLACYTAHLISVGAKCVVHDERSLATLLSSTVSRYSTLREDEALFHLNTSTTGNKTTFWVSKHPIRKRVNEDRHKLEEPIVNGDI